MRTPMMLGPGLASERWSLARDFAHEIGGEWKTWLTGSGPMAALAVLSLADPEWVRLPAWTWAILIFVAGLVAAMFRVYRDLRRQRDAFRAQIAGLGVAGPFLLVPFEGTRERTHDL